VASLDLLLNDKSFSSSELWAMSHDGEIFLCADKWIPSNVVLTQQMKAESVVERFRDDYAPSGLSALWIYGYFKEPCPHTMAMKTRRRPSDELSHVRKVRDLGDLVGRTTRIGDVECLSPTEALIEVLKDPSVPNDTVQELVRNLLAVNPELLADCNDFVSKSQRVPYTELMKRRLKSYPSLTR
jgi:hypothetical protein